ncbi:DUF695 domain-containing protein [Lipingzhangella sp. LS1_29]|uniref:DUF695 domain-containing protein n=1 Tax=Lipingzhangella rawalii TaxID=2055835 RepID=A0ABU2H9M3_9ACTN|nr:DUF695 domain-containing protein [Lipingzhangella rawalii]MDS1272020.1 DUF695 domain-containing protein [Lipingzhangella rawalii]
MALFRRKSSAATDPAVAIAEFWAAWPELRDALARALDGGEPVPEDIASRMDERVRRIHPKLEWEIARASDPLAGLGLEDLSDSALADLAELNNLDPQDADGSTHPAGRSAATDPADGSAGSDDTPAPTDMDETDAARSADRTDAAETPANSTETGQYTLTLTGGTDDAVRVLAERWRQAAPEDGEWSFHPARQADHDQLARTLSWGDHQLDLSHATVALRVNQSAVKIEASVFHPDFMFLAEDVQHAVARHITLLALGEDDLVRWIGAIHPLTEKPLDPLPPTSMPSVVRQLTSALGSGGWVVAQGRIPVGGPFEITLRHPLSRRDYPAFTLYVLVTVPYANSGQDRLPTADSARALTEFSDTLSELLGEHGALLAHRTMGGQRQFHFYLDPESGILPQLEQALEQWPEGRATLSSFLDPDWQAIEQLAKPLRRKLGR